MVGTRVQEIALDYRDRHGGASDSIEIQKRTDEGRSARQLTDILRGEAGPERVFCIGEVTSRIVGKCFRRRYKLKYEPQPVRRAFSRIRLSNRACDLLRELDKRECLSGTRKDGSTRPNWEEKQARDGLQASAEQLLITSRTLKLR
ncbi:hypothetical protein PUN28_011407 [Cardiocondyla obscurior]|uniref:Uncharacterized protein n=1 Tax=Cardiocondyla obscurior TaxID=286306 RepID=A0AAW2FIS1_9HYME